MSLRRLPEALCVSRTGNRIPAEGTVDVPRLSVTDSRGTVWSARTGAIESRVGERVKTYTPADGLPYDKITSIAAGEGGVWFATPRGAIRFDGKNWEYRQGLRWLPDDDVRAIAVEANGNAWFATKKGVGLIERRSITLAEKAKFFEDEIDLRHRRTPYGYVLGVRLKRPGDKSEWMQQDSDNDGLWTSMYGAGECFAYAATGSELAKKRAKAAFEALRFLRVVTEGGEHPAPRGFVARSILPTSGPDPNKADSREHDEQKRQKEDRLWKVMSPRWPVSADGKWYWKTDTSSDELDGHFFFYALYYDLVASTDEEKARVREQVTAIADHLLDHNFHLVDYDGQPTRWGVFNPESLNHDSNWLEERGLNSLSILTYLKIAGHVSGDAKYSEAARKLIEQHAYDQNILIPKTNAGPGSGNQSDDEMAFMDFYNLIRYETDPKLLRKYALAFSNYWSMERPELNPLFNFMYAAANTGKTFEDAYGKRDLSPTGDWLEESMDTLRRYPLDRVNWRLTNSHRTDIVPLPAYAREGRRERARLPQEWQGVADRRAVSWISGITILGNWTRAVTAWSLRTVDRFCCHTTWGCITSSSTPIMSNRIVIVLALLAPLLSAQPVQLEKLENKTILVFTPHPDDDTFCCAGTLALLAKRQNNIHIVIYTNDDKGSRDPEMTSERLARIRQD